MVTIDIVPETLSASTRFEKEEFADELLRKLFEVIRAEGLALKHPGDMRIAVYVSPAFWDEAQVSRWVTEPQERRAGVVGIVLGLEILIDPSLSPEVFRVSDRLFRIPTV